MNYEFHPAAEAEHLESVAYFESERAGLGASYLYEFEETMQLVCEAPHRYPVEKGADTRLIRMKRFPYKVYYREISGSVQVLAVAHQRRKPGYWQSRL